MSVRPLAILLTALIGFLGVGCDQDPFSMNSRHLVGDYALRRWEDGQTYYLEDRKLGFKDGGGAVDGAVEKIGWNSKLIAVKRRATVERDGSGWMLVSVETKMVQGPFTDEQMQSMKEARDMTVMDASSVWAKL